MNQFKLRVKGFVLPVIIISSTLIFLIASIIASQVIANYRLAQTDIYRLNAQSGADAGADAAITELNEDEEWAGSGGEVDLINTTDQRVTYEVTITDVDDDNKVIRTTGRSYSPGNAATPRTERIYDIAVEGLSPNGNFSLVTGVGGLSMSNSASIVAGDVLVNGEIDMSNSASIGLAANPVTVQVSHQSCPSSPDATYPRVCNSGESGQPITINNTAHIYGEVRATNQTSGAGMSDPGLIPNQTVPPQALPTHDRAAQVAAVTTTMSASAASCSGSSTRTWQANTHITGNVSVSNSCRVTVLGDVWIDGRLTVSNSARITIDDSVGTDRPSIMIDGQNGFSLSNSAQIVSNASNTGAHIITYYSTASCSPGCADVTGADLYNSRDDTTISLSNNTRAPDTLLHAKWTRVTIANSGDIGAVVGQMVQLTNTATITFGTSVAGGEDTKIWDIRSYKRVFE